MPQLPTSGLVQLYICGIEESAKMGRTALLSHIVGGSAAGLTASVCLASRQALAISKPIGPLSDRPALFLNRVPGWAHFNTAQEGAGPAHLVAASQLLELRARRRRWMAEEKVVDPGLGEQEQYAARSAFGSGVRCIVEKVPVAPSD